MRVLALCSYPKEAAATRFRLEQFVEPLRERGIELEVSPFLDTEQFKELYTGGSVVGKAARMVRPVLRRIGGVLSAYRFDLLLVQREAVIFGPGVFEWLYSRLGGLPMVLDLDDATYVHYVSPTYGRLGSFLKFFGKADNLIKRSAVVTCGNRFIGEYVERQGTQAVVIPTVVDLDEFHSCERLPDNGAQNPVIGWIGTHSTFPFLESLFPVLEQLALKHRFILKIVGAGRAQVRLKGVEVENLNWKLDREIDDFQSLDIGLYPITVSKSANSEWIKGKSGFKAVQYMAVGIPFVMSPVGVCAEMGEPGKTHYNAQSAGDWYNALDKLMSGKILRRNMGAAGRRYALLNYGLNQQADKLAGVIRKVILR
jgi:glycosyltransferase involved in cell wall biosynthesis